MDTTEKSTTERQKFSLQVDALITDLNALRNFVVDHPDVPTPVLPRTLNGFTYGTEALVAAVRAMKDQAPLGAVRKDFSDRYALLHRNFGSLTLSVCASRDEVCEQVVVGTETVEVPDPEALAAVPVVSVERDVTEWRCLPLLSVDEPASEPTEAGVQAVAS